MVPHVGRWHFPRYDPEQCSVSVHSIPVLTCSEQPRVALHAPVSSDVTFTYGTFASLARGLPIERVRELWTAGPGHAPGARPTGGGWVDEEHRGVACGTMMMM